MSNKLEDLKPAIKSKAAKAIDLMNHSPELKVLGVEKVAISETKRDLAVQMAYYSRSRMQPRDVKAMYKAAGLYDPTDKECCTPNTWTLQSKHLEGLAIDIVPVKNGSMWWSAPIEVWQEMGRIGKEAGMAWGGDWKSKDCPHFEV